MSLVHSTRLWATLLAGTIGFTGACSSQESTKPAGTVPAAALTALPRPLSAAEHTVLDASNAFSFALWHQINGMRRDSNVFVSPLSASFSLSMAMTGASNGTLDEMRATLQLGTAPIAAVDSGYAALISLLTALDPSTTLQIANSIWYRNTFSFNQSFLDADSVYFGATIRPLDFSDANGSVNSINSWVSSATHGKIPSIVDAIESNDVMFLVNAIYFKGNWRSRFDPSLTHSAPFHADGGDETANLMHMDDGRVAYAESDSFQAVDLPYGDSAFTMTIILPKPTTNVETVAASLTADSWTSLSSRFHTTLVTLDLPKVTLSWTRDLIPDLQTLGMQAAFSSVDADFSAMSPLGHALVISQVRQKTFVDIDEEGTEAAAATATGITATALPVTQIVRVDRPFILAIRERLSGTVLFLGKIVRLP